MTANGQLDAALLTPIPGTSFLLRTGAAAAWAAVCHEVQRRFGWTPTLNDAYRDLGRQVALLEANYDHTWRAGMTEANGGLRVWGGSTWYRKPGKATAAKPGTSNHGWGMAIDVDDLDAAHSTRWTQFATVAQPLSWSWSEALGESWHWDYAGAADTVSNVVSQVLGEIPAVPTVPIPTAPVPEEDIVATIDDMRKAIAAELIRPIYRLRGTAACWDNGLACRQWVTGARSEGRPVVDLEATDNLWDVPIVGGSGELLHRPGQQAYWLLTDERTRKWITHDEFAAHFEGRVTITAVAADNPLWTLFVATGALPPEGA